jgi:hypothetical protein
MLEIGTGTSEITNRKYLDILGTNRRLSKSILNLAESKGYVWL